MLQVAVGLSLRVGPHRGCCPQQMTFSYSTAQFRPRRQLLWFQRKLSEDFESLIPPPLLCLRARLRPEREQLLEAVPRLQVPVRYLRPSSRLATTYSQVRFPTSRRLRRSLAIHLLPRLNRALSQL